MKSVITRIDPKTKAKQYLQVSSRKNIYEFEWKDVYWYATYFYKEHFEKQESICKAVNLLTGDDAIIEQLNTLYEIRLDDTEYKLHIVLSKDYVRDINNEEDVSVISFGGLRKKEDDALTKNLYSLTKAQLLCDALEILVGYKCKFVPKEVLGYKYM